MHRTSRIARVRALALLCLSLACVYALFVSTASAQTAAQDQYGAVVPVGTGTDSPQDFANSVTPDSESVTDDAVEDAADKNADPEAAAGETDVPDGSAVPQPAAATPEADGIGETLKSTFSSTTGKVVAASALVAAGGILLSISGVGAGAAIAGTAAAGTAAAASAGAAAAGAAGATAAGGTAAGAAGGAAGGASAGAGSTASGLGHTVGQGPTFINS